MFPLERLRFNHSLYLIANRSSFPSENVFISKILQAVEGGATCVQYRDYDSEQDVVLRTAARLRAILKGVSFFINTRNPFEVTQAVDADGVYLEEKFPYSEARRLLGQKGIIGIPVKAAEEVLALGQTSDVDYLSVKIGLSKRTCPKNFQIVGMEELRKICLVSRYPIVLTGGQSLETIKSMSPELRGRVGFAMAGGLTHVQDTFATARKIREEL